MPNLCDNAGIIDEITHVEAEACDIKKKMKKKAQKMIEGKRKERKLLLSSNKRRKLADRLSGLPNDIIVSILSRLTLKEAARTSVVSHRWKNLWTWTTGTLNFDYADKPSRHYFFGDDCMKPFVENKKPPLVEGSWFVAWVNHVLSLHQGPTVDKFEISCNLRGRLKRTIINKWVKFALRKRVKSLSLDFRGTYKYTRGSYSLKKAFLNKCSLDSLTVLDLKNVDVTGKSLSYILGKCQSLEELCVEKSSTLIELRVPGPLPQLKRLNIKFCIFLKCVEIRAINLKSFAYHGELIPVTFEKAPRLIQASYGGCYASVITANMKQEFLSYASCLESLVLDIPRLSTYLNDGLPEFPMLENLRQLDLGLHYIDVDSIIDCVASLLEKCPILERLSLKTSPVGLSAGVKPRWPERKGICLHNCLRVLELVDFCCWVGRPAEIACFMVSSLPSVQQVIIRVSEVGYNGDILSEEMKKDATVDAYKFVGTLSKIMQERGEEKFPRL